MQLVTTSILPASGPVTLFEAWEWQLRHHPTRPFMLAVDAELSYQETDLLVTNLAGVFQAHGVGKGDRVALMLPRSMPLILAFMAAVRVGAWPVPVNFSFNPQQLAEFLLPLGPKVLVVDHKFTGQLAAALTTAPGLLRIVVGGELAGALPWSEACAARGGHSPWPEVTVDDVLYLNYTTGTSGTPKGALATHANLYWNTRAAIEGFALGPEDIHLCMFAPFAHPHELLLRPILTGGALVLLDEINPKTIVHTVQRHGVTCMMGLAPMYDMMVNHCSGMAMPTLRIAESGGMYTRPDISQGFNREFGIPVLSVWGSTETSGIALANLPHEFRMDGSMGRPCPHYEIKLVDEEGGTVPTGEIGELLIRGAGVVPGYLEATPFPCADGWYATGDLGRQDAAGYFYFMERKSGMIKVAGLKVYPLQVELQLLEHPDIKEVAVLGVNEKRRGMIPMAFVVTRSGGSLNPHDLQNFCRARMPNYMIPKEFTYRAELPKIGSGKIDKKTLRSQIMEDR